MHEYKVCKLSAYEHPIRERPDSQSGSSVSYRENHASSQRGLRRQLGLHPDQRRLGVRRLRAGSGRVSLDSPPSHQGSHRRGLRLPARAGSQADSHALCGQSRSVVPSTTGTRLPGSGIAAGCVGPAFRRGPAESENAEQNQNCSSQIQESSSILIRRWRLTR